MSLPPIIGLPFYATLVVIFTYFYTQKFPVKDRTRLVVLGSGGHTGEMLAMLAGLDYDPKTMTFCYGSGDALSVERARACGYSASQYHSLPRARGVGQSKFTSCFTCLWTLLVSCRILWRIRPQLMLCNGPGTCLMVVLATRLLLLRTKVVYIESLARVKTLSLTGKLLYRFQLADKFVVQWPELANAFPGVEYGGLLV